MNASSHPLVEHYFRHEYGRLVAMLTRKLGIRHIDLAEDVVQHALSRALQTWGQRGVPNDPGAWLYRTASNFAVDALRRKQLEKLHQESQLQTDPPWSPSVPTWEAGDAEIEDESIRLLFLSCQPSISFESRVAFALKLVGGFSTQEIATALLLTKANAEKRIYRATGQMREEGIELQDLTLEVMQSRLTGVEATIYLIFNEGYSSSSSSSLLRKDLCDEAIRLGRMLLLHNGLAKPSTYALLALMLMHRARMEARLGHDGSIVLLENQDRNLWDWKLIREAMHLMAQSAQSNALTRYHLESAIAWEHCRVRSFSEIEWTKVAELYQMLEQYHPGPMVRLNRAIAVMNAQGAQAGFDLLVELSSEDRKRLRPWWDCAVATALTRLDKPTEAILHWQDALVLASNESQQELIRQRITNLESTQLLR